MEPNTFPFRLDARTRKALSSMIGIMVSQDVRLSATTGHVHLIFLEKGAGNHWPMDATITFTRDGMQIYYPMNAVAKGDSKSMAWLKRYQQWIVSKRGNLAPDPERCGVLVEARFDGQLRYHFSYMARHEDNSFAQDLPQGRLYHTEALFVDASEPAPPAQREQKPAELAPQAAWT